MNYILSVFFGVHKQTDPNIACSTMRNAPRISRPYQSFRSKAYWFQEICQRLCQNVYIYIISISIWHNIVISCLNIISCMSAFTSESFCDGGDPTEQSTWFLFSWQWWGSHHQCGMKPTHLMSNVENWINARSRKITNRIGDFEKSNLFPAPNLSKIQPRRPRSGF